MNVRDDPAGVAQAVPRRPFLLGLNPLSKLLAPAPAMLLLLFVRDLLTPLAFIVLGFAVLVAGARLSRRHLLLLFGAIPLGVLVLTLGFAVWIDPNSTGPVPGLPAVAWQLGPWTMPTAALVVALATALRLAAILTLALIVGLSTTGTDLVRALVQHLRLPYRFGYTALAALRFVPRFQHELNVIRSARRVRGFAASKHPLAVITRTAGTGVALLASAIRHAERVALAMDSRAFGAFGARTERYAVPLRRRDAVFAALFLAVSTAIFVVLFPWQLPQAS